jgi:hypothetical protein
MKISFKLTAIMVALGLFAIASVGITFWQGTPVFRQFWIPLNIMWAEK